MISVFHWINEEDRQKVIQDVVSVIREGGFLAISGGSGDHLHPQDHKTSVLSSGPFAEYPMKSVAKFLKKAEITQLYKGAGLINLKIYHRTKPNPPFDGPRGLIDWISSSSFGNFFDVSYLPEHLRPLALERINKVYDGLIEGKFDHLPSDLQGQAQRDIRRTSDGKLEHDTNVLIAIGIVN